MPVLGLFKKKYPILVNTCSNDKESIAFTYKAYINGNYYLSYGVIISNNDELSTALAMLRRILLKVQIDKDLINNLDYYIWYNGAEFKSSRSIKRRYLGKVKNIRNIILSWPFSSKGPNKAVNEDSVGFLSIKYCGKFTQKLVHIFAIADGVSNLQRGDYASSFAVRSFITNVSSIMSSVSDPDLKSIVMDIHNELLNISRNSNIETGTTFTGGTITYVNGIPKATITHIGDSRAYRVIGGSVERLTRDHSLGEHVITQALGYVVDNIDLVNTILKPGSYLVLATDGVTDVLTDEQIGHIVYSSRNPSDISMNLVQTARIYGSQDDASALTIWYT